MHSPARKRPFWLGTLALFAIVFGLLTVFSGGWTLFNAEAQRIAGNYVAFVLWFNFIAGFVYIVAGVGLWRQAPWSTWLAVAIAAATVLTFTLFGLQVWRGGSYEMRTVAAMALRAATWLGIAAVAYAKLRKHPEVQGV